MTVQTGNRGLMLALGWLALLPVGSAVIGQPGRLSADEDPGRRTIYQWTDDDGNLHVTEDPGKIPADHRRTATERTWDDIPANGKLPAAPPTRPPREPPPSPPPVTSGDPAGWKAAQWQAEQRRLVQKYNGLIAQINLLSRSLSLSRATGKPPQHSSEILDQLKSAQGTLRKTWMELARFPDKVRALGGNRAWVEEIGELGLTPPEDIRF